MPIIKTKQIDIPVEDIMQDTLRYNDHVDIRLHGDVDKALVEALYNTSYEVTYLPTIKTYEIEVPLDELLP